ncbi:SDR family NAD(P)-dependent oxidoreductase, partial [Pseudomonas sp.]|uniref:SDR family NAD(P)-dependent oxidoreductase n=3 Tax=Pseudomonas TaxID=286 RepID=UPI0028A91DB9
MHISLNGKRAIVSGSTAGIGLAIAIGLAEAGAEVVLNGRTQARVDEALKMVRERLPQARIIGIAADLG